MYKESLSALSTDKQEMTQLQCGMIRSLSARFPEVPEFCSGIQRVAANSHAAFALLLVHHMVQCSADTGTQDLVLNSLWGPCWAQQAEAEKCQNLQLEDPESSKMVPFSLIKPTGPLTAPSIYIYTNPINYHNSLICQIQMNQITSGPPRELRSSSRCTSRNTGQQKSTKVPFKVLKEEVDRRDGNSDVVIVVLLWGTCSPY